MEFMLENLVYASKDAWKRSRKSLAAALLGFGILGAGPMPAYGQQKEKYAAKVNYVHCTPQKTTASGEEDMGELLTILGVMAESSKKPETQKWGAVLSTLGVMEHQKEVAREGRAQITINQGGQNRELERYVPAPGCVWANPEDPNNLTVKRSIGVAFVANYWRDLNYDKRGDINEYVGVKDKFYDNEPIIVAIHDQAGQGIDEVLKLEVYDPKGKRVFKKLVFDGWGRWSLKPGGSKHYRLDWAKKNGGYGNYVIVWRSQGMTEMTKFEIVPSPKKEND